MTTASDEFTNTNGTALATHNADWTVLTGTVVIQSNAAVGNTNTAGSLARYAGTWGADQWSAGTMSDPGTNSNGTAGVAVRAAASGYTAYVAEVGNSGGADVLYVSRYNAGTYADLRTTNPFPISEDDVLKLEVSGTGATVTLKVYLNDVQQGTDITDSSGSRLTSGSPGLSFYDDGQLTSVKSWQGADSAAGSIVPQAMANYRMRTA
jgi:hypothetical protein